MDAAGDVVLEQCFLNALGNGRQRAFGGDGNRQRVEGAIDGLRVGDAGGAAAQELALEILFEIENAMDQPRVLERRLDLYADRVGHSFSERRLRVRVIGAE